MRTRAVGTRPGGTILVLGIALAMLAMSSAGARARDDAAVASTGPHNSFAVGGSGYKTSIIHCDC
jgi:hypothetical protein